MSLRLSQLRLLENQRLPADLGDGLVFWHAELERLAERIDQLYTETGQEKTKRRWELVDDMGQCIRHGR